MKFVSCLAVAATLVVATASIAHAKDCGSQPSRPSIPNGASATDEEMKAAQAKLTPYAKAMSEYLRCLSEQMKTGKDEYDEVTADWKKQSDIFVKTPAKQ